MLRNVWVGETRPSFFPLAGEDTFDRGMVAQLKVVGNEVVVGVSDGTAPLGLIDDVRTTSFLRPQRDEVVIIAATGIVQGGTVISTADVKGELDYAGLIKSSFRVDEGPQVSLNEINGVVTVPAGTELNYDSDEDGTNDSFRLVVSYYYRVPEIPGEDSTDGSGKVTVWLGRGVYQTDQYDMNSQYYLNARLYVGLDGKLTANQPTADHPQVGFVTGPPSSLIRELEFFWRA
jgi:hypothetical protein